MQMHLDAGDIGRLRSQPRMRCGIGDFGADIGGLRGEGCERRGNETGCGKDLQSFL
jgi:hypothetical protein